MSETWLAWCAIAGGFIGLIWSADRFVAGSAALASNFGVSKLVIGLTVVSFGTSAPEIVVSISASLKEVGDLAVGNALGSNLANIGLVLGVTALVAPLPIQGHLLRQEIPFLLLVTALAGWLLYDATLSRWEGILLIASLIPVMVIMIASKNRHPSPEEEDTDIPDMGGLVACLWFALGLAALILSSEILVWGAKEIATAFGVSPLIIGLTVIAVGTSLPELAASVMSALKGHHDIALGNIIGSNIFNLLAVMAVPGLIQQPHMEAEVFNRDYLVMAAITAFLCLAITLDYYLRNLDTPEVEARGSHGRLGRRIGSILLLGYVGYYVLLFSPD